MRNFQDALYACNQVSATFKKSCSPVSLDTYEQNKTKSFLDTLVDISKETACEEIQSKETLLELELPKVLVSLNKRSDFWKYLSTLYT